MAHYISLKHISEDHDVVECDNQVYNSNSEIPIANNEQLSITALGSSWEIQASPTSSSDVNYTISEGHTVSFPIVGDSKAKIVIEAICQSCNQTQTEAPKKIILVRVKMMATHNIPQV